MRHPHQSDERLPLEADNARLRLALEAANKLLWQEGYTTAQPEVAAIEAALANKGE